MTGTSAISLSPLVAAAAVQQVADASLRTAQPVATGDLVSLAIGEPGFDTPPAIRLAAHACIETGYTRYAHPNGDPELRDALASVLNQRHGTDHTSENILVTHGGTGGLAAAILAIGKPSDRVAIPRPHLLPLRRPDRPRRRTTRRRAAASRPALGPRRARRRAVRCQGLRVLQPAPWCCPARPTANSSTPTRRSSPRSTSTACDSAILYCQSFSKAYAMTGWRLGYLASDRDLIAAAARGHAVIVGPLNSATQRAALVAIEQPPPELATMQKQYQEGRDLMIDGLGDIPGLHLTRPDGAIYAFPRYDADLTSLEMVAHLRSRGVAVRPGSEFGAAGEHHIRLSHAADPNAISTGIDRIPRPHPTLNRENPMSTPFRELHHICLVVHDLDKTQGFYESIGVGPWQDYPPLTEYSQLDVPNADAFRQMRYRFVDLDNIQLQLCQPPELDCPQRRFLDTRGEGVFHLGFEADIDIAIAQGRDLGLEVQMRGQRPNGSGFVYFNTVDQAGVTLEARRSAS